jgi:Flp pilus assembly protein TadB
MAAGDVVAIVGATVLAMLVAALATLLVLFARWLAALRETVEELRRETLALLEATSETVREAADDVARVDALVSSAERLDETKRVIATPMVKAMAFGTGVSRAAQRLVEGEPTRRSRRRRRAS